MVEPVTVRIGGSFTATVWDLIPDYCLDDTTLQVAVVTCFQSGPFTLFLGEEQVKQLKVGAQYVFEIAEKNRCEDLRRGTCGRDTFA